MGLLEQELQVQRGDVGDWKEPSRPAVLFSLLHRRLPNSLL